MQFSIELHTHKKIDCDYICQSIYVWYTLWIIHVMLCWESEKLFWGISIWFLDSEDVVSKNRKDFYFKLLLSQRYTDIN